MTSTTQKPCAGQSSPVPASSSNTTTTKTALHISSPPLGSSANGGNRGQAGAASAHGPRGSSSAASRIGNGQGSGVHAGSLRIVSTSGQGPRYTVTTIEWENLTGRSRWTLRQLAFPISLGFTERELARRHRRTVKWVEGRLEQLRNELAGGAGKPG